MEKKNRRQSSVPSSANADNKKGDQIIIFIKI